MPRIIEGVRDRILDSAQVIFEKDGFAQADMRSIAEAAGIAVGTLYNYYSNKNELFSMVLYRMWQRTVERVDAAANEKGDPWIRLRRLETALIESMDQSRCLGLRIIEALAEPDGVRGALNIERIEQAHRKLVKAFYVPLKDWADLVGVDPGEQDLERLSRLAYAMAREIHEMPKSERIPALNMTLTLIDGYLRNIDMKQDAVQG